MVRIKLLILLLLVSTLSYGQGPAHDTLYDIGDYVQFNSTLTFAGGTKFASGFYVNPYIDSFLLVTIDTSGNLWWHNHSSWLEISGGGGGGGISSLSQSYGIILTPNPITSTGTVKVDTSTLFPKLVSTFAAGTGISISGRTISNTGVTSVATAWGLLGGTITTTGTLKTDSATEFTYYAGTQTAGYGLIYGGRTYKLDSGSAFSALSSSFAAGYGLTFGGRTYKLDTGTAFTYYATTEAAGYGLTYGGRTYKVDSATLATYILGTLSAGSGVSISGRTISATGLGGTVVNVIGGTNITITGTSTIQPTVNLSGVIAVANGGTNKSSAVLYDILYATSTTAYGAIPIGTPNQFLRVNSGATGYIWGALVSGDIPNNAANTTGSAASLTTSRNIFGQSFNGSANVAGAMTATSTVLNGATSGSVTELPPGTVTSYTWSPPNAVAASTGMVMQVYSISGTTAFTSWATVSGGGGGGTPGGSNTQIQYNNSGSFGGSSHLTLVSNVLTTDVDENINGVSFGSGGSSTSIAIGNGSGSQGKSIAIGTSANPGNQGIAIGHDALGASGQTNSIGIGYQGGYALSSYSVCLGDALCSGAPAFSVIISDATGGCCSPVVLYEHGTTHNVIMPSPGSYSLPSDNGAAFQVAGGSLSISTLTHSTLPSSPVAGMMAFITDLNVPAVWGAAATAGGGSNPALLLYDGTNWTVIGK